MPCSFFFAKFFEMGLDKSKIMCKISNRLRN
jgi:hypothetical protein